MSRSSLLPHGDIRIASPIGLVLIFGFAWIIYLAYAVAKAIYNLYFHPLHKFPGPRLWIAVPVIRQIAEMRGVMDERLKAFHDAYGEVVRFSADELSFISEQSWKDIYGHGHRQFTKRTFRLPGEPPDILFCDDADHSRFRKSLSHGFSEKALRDQESLISVYIEMLIEHLRGFAVSGEKVDMVKWYNLTTFDLIGDLAFGESFGGLRDGEMHGWVSNIFKSVKIMSMIHLLREYPIVIKVLFFFLPKNLAHAKKIHHEYGKMTVMKRVQNQSLHGRGDFLDSMMKHKGDRDELSDAELVENSKVLVIAGSETTATLLSGVTYWLLRTPDAMRKVTEEVRRTFETEKNINFQNATSRLPYMLACLDEALRIYPPVPSGTQRITPDGEPVQICGYDVPPRVFVSTHQFGTYRSPTHFHLPSAFLPERWLEPATTDPTSPFYNDKRGVLQPFGVGPRNCIGRNLAYNEMRLILARVLWNFDLELCPESENWSDQKIYRLWERGPLMCRLHSRPRN